MDRDLRCHVWAKGSGRRGAMRGATRVASVPIALATRSKVLREGGHR